MPVETPGLIWAYRVEANGKASEVKGPVKLASTGGGFLWLHFDLVDARSALWINRQQPIPEAARNSLLSRDVYQRLDHIGPLLFGAIAEAGEGGNDLLRFVMGPDYIITGQRHALSSLRHVYEMLQGPQRFGHPSSLLEAIVQISVNRQRELVDGLTTTVNAVEDKLLVGRARTHSEEKIGHARRQLVHLNRNLASLDALFRRFSRYSAEYDFPAEVCTTAQRIVQQIQTLHADVHALQERARLIRDEIESQQAREMNSSLFILSIVSATVLPPSLIFSFFGINAGGLPLVEYPAGWLIVLISGATSSWLVYRALRRGRGLS